MQCSFFPHYGSIVNVAESFRYFKVKATLGNTSKLSILLVQFKNIMDILNWKKNHQFNWNLYIVTMNYAYLQFQMSSNK